MGIEKFKITLLFLINTMLFAATSYAEVDRVEKHILVTMRMIGHQVLLQAGDSVSPVFPVEKVDGRYKIRFASDFQFNPDRLVYTIDSIVKSTGIANRYIAEVEKCETGEVIYTFEIGNPSNPDVIPCKTRTPIKACYNILITLMDEAASDIAGDSSGSKKQFNSFIPVLLTSTLLILMSIFFYYRKNIQAPNNKPDDPNLITIGGYRFDRMNSELLVEDQRVELSAKESDLLHLLYNAANTTVEREVILRNIWGSEGDYVGRTLDVFISKLRKKLEVDTSVKIVNIRGVGYKLVMNVQG